MQCSTIVSKSKQVSNILRGFSFRNEALASVLLGKTLAQPCHGVRGIGRYRKVAVSGATFACGHPKATGRTRRVCGRNDVSSTAVERCRPIKRRWLVPLSRSIPQGRISEVRRRQRQEFAECRREGRPIRRGRNWRSDRGRCAPVHRLRASARRSRPRMGIRARSVRNRCSARCQQ